ncbi:MAG: Gfo/Idh/MocA family protein [Planctomycetota bacterium]|jgi:predicted dehydrogenase
MKPVTVAIVGAGDRGAGYASYIHSHPETANVVAVAEPIDVRRERMAQEHGIAPENVFSDWKDFAARGRLADAVIIGTQDRMHTGPALACAAKGYHILLEKPIASTLEECKQIVDAVKNAGVVFAVGHVMRYGPYWREIKKVIDSGDIGEVVNVQLLEPVGYWHQAHSFVRGHWRNSEQSSFMLLAKSCHDLDVLRYLIGNRCLAASSFGSLTHFKESEKPEGAGDRCVACDYEPKCPYSARKIYLTGKTEWPVSSLTDDLTPEGIEKAVEEGPYGRCVYECDNDVVDHQVVNLLYEDDVTASFTMCAFNPAIGRQIRVMGTRGEITGNRATFDVYDFLTDKVTHCDPSEMTDEKGHGGGDAGIMRDFLAAAAAGDPSMVTTGPDESLESHIAVFAAENARLKGTVEKTEDYR